MAFDINNPGFPKNSVGFKHGRVSRRSDYDPNTKLIVAITESADASVMIMNAQGSMDLTFAGVGGGGRSPKTRAALVALLEAMREDEREEKF